MHPPVVAARPPSAVATMGHRVTGHPRQSSYASRAVQMVHEYAALDPGCRWDG